MEKIITSILCLCGVFALSVQISAQDNIWDREQLSGDWGSKRSAWSEQGYQFSFSYEQGHGH